MLRRIGIVTLDCTMRMTIINCNQRIPITRQRRRTFAPCTFSPTPVAAATNFLNWRRLLLHILPKFVELLAEVLSDLLELRNVLVSLLRSLTLGLRATAPRAESTAAPDIAFALLALPHRGFFGGFGGLVAALSMVSATTAASITLAPFALTFSFAPPRHCHEGSVMAGQSRLRLEGSEE